MHKAVFAGVLVAAWTLTAAAQTTPPAPSRAEDEKAIRLVVETFTKAYNAGDAKTIAGLFVADGEIVNEQGESVQGQAGHRTRVRRNLPGASQVADQGLGPVDSVRQSVGGDRRRHFDGHAPVRPAGGAEPLHGRPREAGRPWRMASARDLPDEAASADEELKQLAVADRRVGGREPRRAGDHFLSLGRRPPLDPERVQDPGRRPARHDRHAADRLGPAGQEAPLLGVRLRRRIRRRRLDPQRQPVDRQDDRRDARREAGLVDERHDPRGEGPDDLAIARSRGRRRSAAETSRKSSSCGSHRNPSRPTDRHEPRFERRIQMNAVPQEHFLPRHWSSCWPPVRRWPAAAAAADFGGGGGFSAAVAAIAAAGILRRRRRRYRGGGGITAAAAAIAAAADIAAAAATIAAAARATPTRRRSTRLARAPTPSRSDFAGRQDYRADADSTRPAQPNVANAWHGVPSRPARRLPAHVGPAPVRIPVPARIPTGITAIGTTIGTILGTTGRPAGGAPGSRPASPSTRSPRRGRGATGPTTTPTAPAPVVVDDTTIDYSQPIALARRRRPTQRDPAGRPGRVRRSVAARRGPRRLRAGRLRHGAGPVRQGHRPTAQRPVLHEFRGLALFALHRYKEAAGTIYAVLSVGPGWDWTTLSSFYPDVDVYTEQLRALEQYVNANPNAAEARFLLAYHYMTCGHTDAAATQFKAVVQLNPKDQLSAQLLGRADDHRGRRRRPRRPRRPSRSRPPRWSAIGRPAAPTGRPSR